MIAIVKYVGNFENMACNGNFPERAVLELQRTYSIYDGVFFVLDF